MKTLPTVPNQPIPDNITIIPEALKGLKPSFILGSEGPIAKNLPEYEVRSAQIQLADFIQQSFEEPNHLIAEAQTGTGKSYAAILAAAKSSYETGKPVVISTHTIALQEQLFYKDVPFLKKYLNLHNLKVVLAKGRSNYISLRRANLAERKLSKSSDEVKEQYLKLRAWIKNVKLEDSPSLSDIDFKPNPQLWAAVKSDSDDCLGEKCPTHSQCHFYGARKKLEEAHIIITNHNLVLLDRKMRGSGMEGGLLPAYNNLIIDEAHELESVARQVFSFEFRQIELERILNELYSDDGTGLLNERYETYSNNLTTLLESGKPLDSDQESEKSAVINTVKTLIDLKEAADEYFIEVAKFLGPAKLKRFESPKEIKVDLYSKFKLFLDAVTGLSKSFSSGKTTLDFVVKRCSEMAMGVDAITNLPPLPGKKYSDTVAWAASDFGKKNKTYYVASSPIFLKPLMKKLVFGPLKSVILMSATLATAGNDPFALIKSTLGLDEPNQLKLPSVFDFKKQVKAYVVEDLPEQSSPDYILAISEQVSKFVSLSKGGAFVLFTSNDVMQKVYKETKDGLEMQGLQLFLQGDKLNKIQMIEEFKKIKNGVLFGVSSFWTGVDVPGDSLRNLIITKLPFPSPDDPLAKAQEEIYKEYKRNFFMEKSLPITAIMLKQGFGRLIRRKSDTGVVVFLDSRLVTKRYGKYLLSCLPKCDVKYISSKAKT